MGYRLLTAASSETGHVRVSNQDAAFSASWGAAVADGVGGGPSGDLASAAFVHRLVAGGLVVSDADELSVHLREANWDLGAHVRRNPDLRGMATTFTGLVVTTTGELLLAHVGDSRGYRLRHAQLEQQTRDDSYVQVLVDRGLLDPQQAATHPRRNIITASFGGGEDDPVAVGIADAEAGDRWLLCSDGVSDYLDDEEIGLALLRGRTPAAAADALVALALDAGSRDNVTAVVCDVVRGPSDPRELPVFHGSAGEWFQEHEGLTAS